MSRLIFRCSALALLLILHFTTSAQETDKTQLVIFEGSDWCKNCIRLEKTILSDAGFQQFIEENNIEVKRIDFPQRKKLDKATKNYNKKVAQQLGFDGTYPTVLIVNPKTEEKAAINYTYQKVGEFIAMMKAKIETLE